jgi:hypothetical protein
MARGGGNTVFAALLHLSPFIGLGFFKVCALICLSLHEACLLFLRHTGTIEWMCVVCVVSG